MTMTLERRSADKSHLLAYLHHTPGFEPRMREFIELPINEILSRVRETDEPAYRTCIARFRQQGTEPERRPEGAKDLDDDYKDLQRRIIGEHRLEEDIGRDVDAGYCNCRRCIDDDCDPEEREEP